LYNADSDGVATDTAWIGTGSYDINLEVGGVSYSSKNPINFTDANANPSVALTAFEVSE
jgi:hypothetical protein